MKNITELVVIAVIAILCFAACGDGGSYWLDDSYASYNAVGKVIDKETKEPIKDIIVVMYLGQITPQSFFRFSQNEAANCLSDENGEFQVYENFTSASVDTRNDSLSVFFLNSRYKSAFYKDTVIWVDFKNATFHNQPYKDYMGYYTLEMGEIELEKID